jgi:hypothetical protein
MKSTDEIAKVAARREGVVEMSRCPHCGHHAVGIVAADGQVYILRAGDRIEARAYPGGVDVVVTGNGAEFILVAG